ncbi:hypothetical protein [Bacillus sp. 165]|uniref:hypothetical protein n=1 Tax=Bacillus sp. 165 TaxID=1529117 RepID=UPI001ADB781A|nr:hypothetical protein [Bacillus sp. 165]MBO9129031.1 hypothetical protein [Bacillus sp. 165]
MFLLEWMDASSLFDGIQWLIAIASLLVVLETAPLFIRCVPLIHHAAASELQTETRSSKRDGSTAFFLFRIFQMLHFLACVIRRKDGTDGHILLLVQ